jgi:hypothetical protein
MAEVQFLGLGAQGFPDPAVQILTGNRISQAEVINEGLAPAPQGTLDIIREILPASEVLPSEFTTVEFFSNPAPLTPASENPNDSEILFFVDVGGTGPIQVLMVPATIPSADGMVVHPKPVPNDIRLFAGPNMPSGLAGKIIQFIAPTGASVPMPIQGVTGRIASIAAPAASSPFDAEYPIVVSIAFDAPLPVAAVKGDRFVVRSSDRTLRRTPVIEIILE